MAHFRFVLEKYAARGLLTLPTAESGRNSWGVLWFKWRAPCPEIEALWLSITRREIVLSCRHAHLHFSASHYFTDKLTNLHLKQRIARDAVAEAAKFLNGDIAVAAQQREDDSFGSSMWCETSKLREAIAYSREVLGYSKYRAWTWFREVATDA